MVGTRGGILSLSLAGGLLSSLAAGGRAEGPALPSVSIGELRSRGGAMGELAGAPIAGREGGEGKSAVAAKAYPYARLSADVYHGRSEDGCPLVDRREDPDSGFAAFACRERSTGRVVVAFRGTDELKDWVKADIPQPLVLPAQYQQGLDYAKEMKARYGDVVVTGHSLGGGIAQYAALQLGLEAWTFNAAGLGLGASRRTDACAADGTCRPDASRITNVIVSGEPLDAARFFLGPDFVKLHGSVVHFAPAGGGGLTSHGMSNVLAALQHGRD